MPSDDDVNRQYARRPDRSTDNQTHEEPARKFADVQQTTDGDVVFDEGWGDAWIESDTVVEVER